MSVKRIWQLEWLKGQSVADLMTTHEVADYLRLKERKIYELVREGKIPCTKVTGKWLFPRHLIDLWLAEGTDAAGLTQEVRTRPPVVAGSHDPLLDWALREASTDLALMARGSLDGLDRFVAGECRIAGLHIPGDEGAENNIGLVSETCRGQDVVLIEWAVRHQGLLVAPGNPKAIKSLDDLRSKELRVMVRRPEAGSHLLFVRLLAGGGMTLSDLNLLEVRAAGEGDLAQAIQTGGADAAFGIEAAAKPLGLGFVPLATERFDLLMERRDYFEADCQRLLELSRAPMFEARAHALGGYDIQGTGRVRYNAP